MQPKDNTYITFRSIQLTLQLNIKWNMYICTITSFWNFKTGWEMNKHLPELRINKHRVRWASICTYRVSSDFISILQDLIPEAILSQKCYMNMDLTPNGHREMDLWNASCTSRCGHVHKQASAPVTCYLQLIMSSLNVTLITIILNFWKINC